MPTRKQDKEREINLFLTFDLLILFFSFSFFLPCPRHNGSSQARGQIRAATPQPQQCQIRAAPATYASAWSNAGSLNH